MIFFKAPLQESQNAHVNPATSKIDNSSSISYTILRVWYIDAYPEMISPDIVSTQRREDRDEQNKRD